MLLLNPRTVLFGASTWTEVASVSVDRVATRLALDHGDGGPHPVFADVPEQVTRIKVVQELASDDLGAPRPGELSTLALTTSPTNADGPRTRLEAIACVESVTHEVSLKRGTLRTVTLVAISPDGSTDPITTERVD